MRSVRRHVTVQGSVRKGSSRVTKKSMECLLKRLRCIDELEGTRPGERCRARVVHATLKGGGLKFSSSPRGAHSVPRITPCLGAIGLRLYGDDRNDSECVFQ